MLGERPEIQRGDVAMASLVFAVPRGVRGTRTDTPPPPPRRLSISAIAAASLLLCACGDSRGHNFGATAAAFAPLLVPLQYFGLAVTADATNAQRRLRSRAAHAANASQSIADFDEYVGGPVPPALRSVLDPIPARPASSEATRQDSSIDGAAVLEWLDARDLHACRLEGSPPGWNHARITFKPNGAVLRVSIDWTVWMSRSATSCFRSQLSKLSAPPFQGSPVTIGVWFFTF
jgi:hypothetical protein